MDVTNPQFLWRVKTGIVVVPLWRILAGQIPGKPRVKIRTSAKCSPSVSQSGETVAPWPRRRGGRGRPGCRTGPPGLRRGAQWEGGRSAHRREGPNGMWLVGWSYFEAHADGYHWIGNKTILFARRIICGHMRANIYHVVIFNSIDFVVDRAKKEGVLSWKCSGGKRYGSSPLTWSFSAEGPLICAQRAFVGGRGMWNSRINDCYRCR